ncbi:C39 family peptidase [Clostridium sp. ATCC 25772]|uniref:C39 family peptidase n=1 Tax=Clostridium sp. ATCC 25772 TaxID=1676991 RepID=UPI000781394A|nr:C39 family peptidase [Clostridium sp. ATCC 25772]
MNVGIIKQLPELKNGCEVTSVAMMLNHSGIKVDKMTLAEKVKKDNTKIEYDENGNIVKWGNPDIGFVGDITGVSSGYSVNPIPLLDLVNQYVKGINLTNLDYSYIEKSLSENRPVVVWVTSDFTSPQINTSWKNNGETVTAYFNQHAVLLTGYDSEYLYYNDPLTGKVNDKIEKGKFLKIWTNTGRKAITCE